MNRLMIIAAIFACSGCASIELFRMSHWFESNLYVSDLGVQHLSKAEWQEIKSQFAKRSDYSFQMAIRENSDRVAVNLELKTDRSKGMELRFDRKSDGKWSEDESKSHAVDYLIPFGATKASHRSPKAPNPALAMVPSEKKEALRKLLDPEFVLTSVPENRQEDIYQILEAFAADRRPDELVRGVEFGSGSEASLSFSDQGMHGGGVAYLKKKEGRWVLDQKWYRA